MNRVCTIPCFHIMTYLSRGVWNNIKDWLHSMAEIFIEVVYVFFAVAWPGRLFTISRRMFCRTRPSKFAPKQELWESWWRYDMETLTALLVLCEGNPPVTGGFPSQRPIMLEFCWCLCCWPEQSVEKQLSCLWDVGKLMRSRHNINSVTFLFIYAICIFICFSFQSSITKPLEDAI